MPRRSSRLAAQAASPAPEPRDDISAALASLGFEEPALVDESPCGSPDVNEEPAVDVQDVMTTPSPKRRVEFSPSAIGRKEKPARGLVLWSDISPEDKEAALEFLYFECDDIEMEVDRNIKNLNELISPGSPLKEIPASPLKSRGGKLAGDIDPHNYRVLCDDSFDAQTLTMPVLKRTLKAQVGMPDIDDLTKGQLVRIYGHVFGKEQLDFW